MTQTPQISLAEQVKETRLPFKRASTLPAHAYTSDEWLEEEINAIYMKEWVCVGRTEKVKEKGDYFTLDFVGEPLVIVRVSPTEIKAHLNVCRHRAATVAEGCGNVSMFRCPYHSWLYELDGSLKATPGSDKPMSETEGFCKEHFGLKSVRLETWAGFMFINFDDAAPPLMEWLGDLPEKLKNYKLEEMVCTRSIELNVGSNWKLPVENFLEGYHINTVHIKHISSGYPQVWTPQPSNGPWLGNWLKNSVAKIAKFPVIETLTDEEKEVVFHLWLLPNVKLSVASTYMKFFLFFPDGAGRHKLYANWCFPLETTKRPDFEEVVGPNYYGRGTLGREDGGDWKDEIVVEDNDVLERVQKGLASRHTTSGRFASSESLVHMVANYVLDRVGPDKKKIKPGKSPKIWLKQE